MAMRKLYSAWFKGEAAFEATRGDQIISGLAAKSAGHPAMATRWKRPDLAGLADATCGEAVPRGTQATGPDQGASRQGR